MEVPKVSERRRWALGLGVTLLAVALVIAATAFGGTSSKRSAGSTKAKGGYGEVYKANPAVLKKTLFDAKLLPPRGMARNIALAAFGRASRKVNYSLALKCWKNDGCKTGTGGKLTVAYVEPFGENVYRHISKMEFILQALTYKSIGKIIYRTAHSDLNQALADSARPPIIPRTPFPTERTPRVLGPRKLTPARSAARTISRMSQTGTRSPTSTVSGTPAAIDSRAASLTSGAGTKITLASSPPWASTASSTVSYTGTPSTVSPPRPGVHPATTLVP